MAWHDSFDRMKQRPHILVCCPQAVSSAWGKVVAGVRDGLFTAWAHQIAFRDWFADRFGGLLAADMGTGKTFAALLALGATRQHLVHVDLCSGSSQRRAERLQNAIATASGKCLVVTVNYEAVWRAALAPTIESVKWSAIVLDESHRIKAPGGKASRYLAKLATKQQHARRPRVRSPRQLPRLPREPPNSRPAVLLMHQSFRQRLLPPCKVQVHDEQRLLVAFRSCRR